MRSFILDTARIAATFTGTIIGAGFASGQELLQFFISYGSIGFLSLILAGTMFAFFGYRVLTLSHKLNITHYHHILYYLCGRRIGTILDLLISIFLFGGLCIMLSGTGTVCRDYLDIPFYVGTSLMALAIIATSFFGIKGIANINLLVIPLLIFTTVAVASASLLCHASELSSISIQSFPSYSPTPWWFLSCLLYVAYNIVLSLTVLAPLGSTINNSKAHLFGSIIGALLLTSLGGLIILVIVLHYPDILGFEVPMLYIANIQHNLSLTAYGLMLIKAMFSTAIASLYGCSIKLQALTKLSFRLCLILSALAAILFSSFGFANLVAMLYPAFGYVSLILLVFLVFPSLSSKLWHSKQP